MHNTKRIRARLSRINIKNLPCLSVKTVIILTIISAAVLTCAVFFLQFYSMRDIRYGLGEAPVWIFTLNYLPVLLLMLFLLFVSGRFSVSFGVTSLLLVVAAVVNRFKVILRNDPLVPTDFALGAEAFGVSSGISGVFKFYVLWGIIFIGGVLLVIFLKNKPLNPILRWAGAVSCAAVFIALNMTLYSDKELYERLPVIQRYNLVSHYNTKGMIYAFIYQIHEIGIFDRRAPEGFDKNALIKTIETDYPPETYEITQKPPHIIVIMAEAFSDFFDSGAVDYNGYGHPLEHFNALKETGVYGEVVVPHIGGGTADTEFEFLTGFLKRREERLPYAFRIFADDTDSLAVTLGGFGYNSIFVHPGASWFYSRAFVYDLMGFDDLYFDDYFADAPTKGGYINEYDSINACIDLFDEKRREDPDAPVFLYCVTIQTHGPYEDKYAGRQRNFNSDIDFSEQEVNILSNYLQGIKDQDYNLKRLADHLDALGEPAVMLYYGDHMPSMPDSVLRKAGLDFNYDSGFMGTLPLYKTPYLFWANGAAKEQGAVNKAALNGTELISANYLGAALLDYIGFGRATPLDYFLNEMRHEMPVIGKDDFITTDGYKHYDDLTDEQKLKSDLYKHWQYYKLYAE